MNVDELRAAMDRMWEEVNAEAERMKDSFLALDRLHSWYQRLDQHARAKADEVLAEWLLSDVEAKRFDAVALVREFRIQRALSALQELSRRLGSSEQPSAPFEREKVDGLIAELTANGPERVGR
jgi:hypothetical protein